MILQGVKPTIQPLGVGYANRPKKAQNGGVCGVFPYMRLRKLLFGTGRCIIHGTRPFGACVEVRSRRGVRCRSAALGPGGNRRPRPSPRGTGHRPCGGIRTVGPTQNGDVCTPDNQLREPRGAVRGTEARAQDWHGARVEWHGAPLFSHACCLPHCRSSHGPGRGQGGGDEAALRPRCVGIHIHMQEGLARVRVQLPWGQGCIGRGGGTIPPPFPGRPAYAQPRSP